MKTKPIYRMSSAGYCARRLSANRLGLVKTPVPEWIKEAAEEGNWHEARLKDELRANGNVIYSEQEELKISLPEFDLIGHIDGKMKDLNNNIMLLECKSMSRFKFDKWMRGGFAAFPEYAAQLACYFAGSKMDKCYYAVKNRDYGRKDFRIVDREENIFNLESIIEKITAVEELALKGDLYPAEYEVNSEECEYCEYKYLCLEPKKELEEIDKRILIQATESYREGKRLQKRAEEIIEKAQFTLEAYANEQPDKKLFINNLALTYYSVAEAPISYTRKAYNAYRIKDYSKEDG